MLSKLTINGLNRPAFFHASSSKKSKRCSVYNKKTHSRPHFFFLFSHKFSEHIRGAATQEFTFFPCKVASLKSRNSYDLNTSPTFHKHQGMRLTNTEKKGWSWLVYILNNSCRNRNNHMHIIQRCSKFMTRVIQLEQNSGCRTWKR